MTAKIKKLIATFFYIGYLPLIPGTFGSLAGFLIYILLRETFYVLTLVHLSVIILGFLFAGSAAKAFKRRDPPQIVIDEINGILISFFALPIAQAGAGVDKPMLIAGFIIFRILDAIKPYPANLLQRRHGSLGIMGDDIIAGIYTNLILRIIRTFL